MHSPLNKFFLAFRSYRLHIVYSLDSFNHRIERGACLYISLIKDVFWAEPAFAKATAGGGGEGGIRTLGTGLSPYNGLANRPFRPLRHLSVSAPIKRQGAGGAKILITGLKFQIRDSKFQDRKIQIPISRNHSKLKTILKR